MYYTFISNKHYADIVTIHSADVSEHRIVLKGDTGEELGYLTNKKSSLVPCTDLALNLEETDVVGNMYILKSHKISKGNEDFYFHVVDLFPSAYKREEKTSKLEGEVVLLFGGASSAGFPGKGYVLDTLRQGETVPVVVTMEIRDVEGSPKQTLVARIDSDKDNRFCGRFLSTNELPSFPSEFITNGAMKGYARTPIQTWTTEKKSRSYAQNFEVVIVPDNQVGNANFDTKIQELNEKCIDHPQNVVDKITYMRKYNVSDVIIGKVLDSYISYKGMLRTKIKHPKATFVDSDGYIKRALAYSLCGINTRLVGDKGCGKNTLLDTLSWVLNQPLFKIGCNDRTDEYTIFGSTQIKDGDTFHKLSPFANGLIQGGLCVLDEANAASPELMIAINQLADDTREVDLQNYGLLRLHDRTRIFLTMNEDYQGVNLMNEATVDRFQGIFMSSDMNLQDLLSFLVPEADKGDIKVCSRLYDEIETRVMEGSMNPSAITIRGYKDALKASKLLPLDICLKDSIAGRIQDQEDRCGILSLIQGLVSLS